MTLSKTLLLLGPQAFHVFLSEAPSLFLRSSVPSASLPRSWPVPYRPSLLKEEALKAPSSSQASQAAARAASKPQDSLGTGDCGAQNPGECALGMERGDQRPKEP